MTPTTDDDLYLRGAATLVASLYAYARGFAGATLKRLDGVSAAVLPSDPERAVYNNALLDRDLGRAERTAAVDAMEAAYDSAGVDRYAAWVHKSDEGMRSELSGRGYAIDESTRAMGMSLADISDAPPRSSSGRWPGPSTSSTSSTCEAGLRRRRLSRPRPDPRIRHSDARRSRPGAHSHADRRLATVTEILLVSRSLRARSTNSAVLRTAAALAEGGMRTREGPGTLPHFNLTTIPAWAGYPRQSPTCVVGSLTPTPAMVAKC
jgi:hypothetical protein